VAAMDGATAANQGAEIVSAWYHANPADCTKAADKCPGVTVDSDCVHDDVCDHTPASHADAMAAKFETNLHYGHSIARIKVMQALSIMHHDLKEGTETAPIADLKKDALSHMLLPIYQGAIEAAHHMDTAATAGTGLDNGAAYWNIIRDKVSFEAGDKAHLDAIFSAESASGTNNFCEVKAMLHRNLPQGSMMQYALSGWEPCPGKKPYRTDPTCPGAAAINHASDVTGAHHYTAKAVEDEAVHLTAEADLGTLKDAMVDGEPKTCTYPSPAPVTTRSSSDLKTGIADLAAATDSFEVGAGSPSGWGAMIVEEATVSTGTKLVFKWSAGHNVVMTTADAWASCTLGDEGSECLATDTYSDTGDCENGPIATVAGGKNTFEAVVSNVGEYYFICAVPGHCLSQKVKVTVTDGSLGGGKCADGSSVGSNGCCAATNECPPCLYTVVMNTEPTPSAQSTTCICSGCAEETVTIDPTCTSDSCAAGRTGMSIMGCEMCTGPDGTCMPNEAAVSACSTFMPGMSISSSGVISAYTCDACCPVGTCDGPADAHKPECTACNTSSRARGGGDGGGGGAGNVVAVDITSDKSTTGKTMMKTAISALCTCATS